MSTNLYKNLFKVKIGSWKLYFVLLMKPHLQSYPCPLQINSFWNLGFFLGITIIIQIITGIFLGLHYTSDLNSPHRLVFSFTWRLFSLSCYLTVKAWKALLLRNETNDGCLAQDSLFTWAIILFQLAVVFSVLLPVELKRSHFLSVLSWL